MLQPIEDPNELGSTVHDAARRVGITVQEMRKALASFVRSILSGNSRFDRFMDGERSALRQDEQAGLLVFRGKGNCVSCHVGPNFTDERLHNTGVAWRGDTFADPGAGQGRFKTATLREIARTAPYMHDGSIQTIENVIEFYDRGGNPNADLDPRIHPLRLSAESRSITPRIGRFLPFALCRRLLAFAGVCRSLVRPKRKKRAISCQSISDLPRAP